MASSKSDGLIMTFKNRDYKVEALTPESFDRDIDIHFLQPVPRSVKNMYRLLRGKGITVIDNSSAWRRENAVPLVVPEVNGSDIKSIWELSVIQIVAPSSSNPLKPLVRKFGIKRIVFSTYQSSIWFRKRWDYRL